MAGHTTRGKGKLYDANTEELISMVSYQVYEELNKEGALERWWGELTLTDSVRIHDGDKYIIELDDKRQGRCSLRRRVNKALTLVPPRFFYLLQGTGPLV